MEDSLGLIHKNLEQFAQISRCSPETEFEVISERQHS